MLLSKRLPKSSLCYHFCNIAGTAQIRSTWSEESLAEIVGTVPEVLRRKAGFWVKHGVLSEDTDRRGTHTYTRASHLSAQEVGDEVVPIAMDEDEGESALVSQEEQLKQVQPLSPANSLEKQGWNCHVLSLRPSAVSRCTSVKSAFL